jgi:signal transduction histidine kinase
LRFQLSRGTIRGRLAGLFFVVFLASSAVLLAVTVLVWQGRTGGTAHVLHVPHVGALHQRSGTTQHSSDRHQLLIASGIALAVMVALSLILGWLLAGRFLAPVREITAATREISASNLHERLNLVGPDDELKKLGDTFDELLARLERSFEFERQFVTNASHELRTPLAGMRTSLDVAMAKPGPVPTQFLVLAERLRGELDQVDRLLESFLTLAQTEQGPPPDQSTLSLNELVEIAIHGHSGAISAMSLHIEQHTGRDVFVSGSETLLSRMVDNVIDNSINHNGPGGSVRVSSSVEGQFACLSVENSGPVLDPGEVTELARPFRRVGPQRTGSEKGIGLGLTIVASIAEAHGGTLELQAISAGGLRVMIRLPLASRPTAA